MGYTLTLIASLAAGPAPAEPPRLHTFDALQKRLDDPRLRVLDTRPKADYDKGHIPGAVLVDTKAASTLAAKPDGLTDANAWAAWAAPLGLKPDTEVVVVDGGKQLDAARVWWLLRYLGFDDVGLLDGNLPLWKKEGRPWSSEAPRIDPSPAKIAFRADRHATRSEVLDALKTPGAARVVDARSGPEFSGEEKRSARAGRIPAACHVEWSNLVDQNGRFLPEKALRAKFDVAGIRPGESVITHCQSGGRASVDAFVLERLGHPTRNYYLGWSDWGNATETPITTGPK